MHWMFANKAEKDSTGLGEYRAEYAVALTESTWYEKYGKQHASRTTDYNRKGLGYKLRYCPECGKKL